MNDQRVMGINQTNGRPNPDFIIVWTVILHWWLSMPARAAEFLGGAMSLCL